ncbi:hypothetical protein EVAR_24668_1 [Eumeta japonica]|uniref:Uncharacterized protein n=1 Tax=Eumeta variegata TaxID=151549 RepID=A0A4C1WE71_EUMVA|nr:hypothetical protein EVAR_24668_1 [Eumeta japonica]
MEFIRNRSNRARFIFDIKISRLETLELASWASNRADLGGTDDEKGEDGEEGTTGPFAHWTKAESVTFRLHSHTLRHVFLINFVRHEVYAKGACGSDLRHNTKYSQKEEKTCGTVFEISHFKFSEKSQELKPCDWTATIDGHAAAGGGRRQNAARSLT